MSKYKIKCPKCWNWGHYDTAMGEQTLYKCQLAIGWRCPNCGRMIYVHDELEYGDTEEAE